MARERPNLSITLPRNFTFHYTDGNPPRTPEREVHAPSPRSPRAEGPYRIRRRSRPTATIFQSDNGSIPSRDCPIPTTETPASTHHTRLLDRLEAMSSSSGRLSPSLRKFTTLPRTPTPAQPRFRKTSEWKIQQDIGESIIRPMSACSLLSDSSDTSNVSLASQPTGDGSCTSPESDAPDPFAYKFAAIKRGKAKEWAALARNEESIQSGLSTKRPTYVKWSREMDNHLWSTYLMYLQDPTVTPFKMLPGTAPPLGVCHRVAREARRSWRGGRASSQKPSRLLSPFMPKECLGNVSNGPALGTTASSPDTIRAVRSRSTTPTKSQSFKVPSWTKSPSSTRRRLRFLCKNKPTIAPHYQRLMQSRSPSPFSSSPRLPSRSTSQLCEVTNSSPRPKSSSSFNTRDVQLSLTTSTAESMQPDGPLAQLANEDALPAVKATDKMEWFNEPPVPFASGPMIPSDLNVGEEKDEMNVSDPSGTHVAETLDAPRLGSPFGFHTWGPSRSKQRFRPSPARFQSEASAGPSLRSPVRLHETFPYQGIQKRRAVNSLEDELSPNGSSIHHNLLESIFTSPAGRHRRVRSRGFSLGDVHTSNPLEALFQPPTDDAPQLAVHAAPQFPSSDSLEPTTPTQIPRLGSPFNGISPRPTRVRGPLRHLATNSLGSYDANIFHSIGETLGQANASQPPN